MRFFRRRRYQEVGIPRPDFRNARILSVSVGEQVFTPAGATPTRIGTNFPAIQTETVGDIKSCLFWTVSEN